MMKDQDSSECFIIRLFLYEQKDELLLIFKFMDKEDIIHCVI